jgi:hypothetical protein
LMDLVVRFVCTRPSSVNHGQNVTIFARRRE